MKIKSYYFPVFLALVTLVLFGQVVGFEFLTFDDNMYVTENPVIADPGTSLIDCLRYQYHNTFYFPLSNLVFRFERVLFGLNPKVFHGFNLLIYLVNVLLVYFFSLKLLPKLSIKNDRVQIVAFVITLFFSIHPIHVESVAWVIDLKDLLYTAFYLAGLIFYWKWLEIKKTKFIVFALVCSFLSLLSKSTAITFVVMLFLMDYVYFKQFKKDHLLQKVPFFLVALWGLYIFGIFSNYTELINGISVEATKNSYLFYPSPIDGLSEYAQQIYIFIFRFAFWFSQSILPIGQSAMYNRNLIVGQYSSVIVFILIIQIVLIVLGILKRKSHRYLLFGFAFFSITLFPAFAQAETGISTFVPDRYLYLPLLGVLYILVGIISNLKKIPSIILLVLIGLFWSYSTIRYLPTWKTSVDLYSNIIEKDPNNISALANREAIYRENGEIEKALVDLNLLVLLKDTVQATYLNRGKILMDKRQFDNALNDFNTAIKMDSTKSEGYFCRGTLYLMQNNLNKAQYDLFKAYTFDSTNYMCNKNIARLNDKLKLYNEAILFCDKCILTNQRDFEIIKIKANGYFNLNEYEKCEAVLNEILIDGFKNAWFWNFRSVVRFKQGKYDDAYRDYIKAKELGFKVVADYEKTLLMALNKLKQNKQYTSFY